MTTNKKYLEPHFNWIDKTIDDKGLVTLGPLTSASFLNDPRSLLFRASRYKFVAKMISKEDDVLEIGCGDASMSPIVLQSAKSLTCIDADEKMIEHAIKFTNLAFKIQFFNANLIENKLGTKFNVIFSLDVLEHIPLKHEDSFIKGSIKHLNPNGKFIVGTPSLAAQEFTTQANREGHVNCKSNEQLKLTLEKHFKNVLTFGMNDEVIHTGYEPFRNYLFAICFNPID
jgi:2-polyprenyl-3-methyl-5-hydroxy-6-metoxy-1,4-benzoquinol methylase